MWIKGALSLFLIQQDLVSRGGKKKVKRRMGVAWRFKPWKKHSRRRGWRWRGVAGEWQKQQSSWRRRRKEMKWKWRRKEKEEGGAEKKV